MRTSIVMFVVLGIAACGEDDRPAGGTVDVREAGSADRPGDVAVDVVDAAPVDGAHDTHTAKDVQDAPPIDSGDALDGPRAQDADAPTLLVSPQSIDFGSVGFVSCTKPPSRIVRLVNASEGSVGPLSIAVVGRDANRFSLPHRDCERVLGAGELCDVTVVAALEVRGALSATLRIAAGAATVHVPLSITTAPGDPLSMTPTVADFGVHAVRDVSPPVRFTLNNVGGCTFKDVRSSLSGANPGQFAIAHDGCAGAAIAPGASCSVHVAYAPDKAGVHTGTLSLSTPDGAVSASLVGHGI